MVSRVPDSSPASRPGAPNALSATRYLAWLYSAPARQPALAALCEIENEIVSSLRPGIDHQVAHARLQWWREECERAAQGRPVHPLTRELMKTYCDGPAAAHSSGATGGDLGATRRELGVSALAASPLAGISGFVDTAVWDLAAATFETRKELTAYCERWAAAMFQCAATVSDATPIGHGTSALSPSEAPSAMSSPVPSNVSATRSSSSHWRRLGAAVREIELLENLASDAHAGRLRVPVDELEHAGMDMKGLSKPPWPAPLVSLLRERHETLRASITDSVSALEREEQAHFRGLMVWAALAWRQSQRTQRALPNVVLPRRYHALSDGWHAWRTARRAVGGNLRLS